jgi:hypothetical protein
MTYLLVLCNRFKTFKNIDKNPDLLMDLKIATEKPKVYDYCQMFVQHNET